MLFTVLDRSLVIQASISRNHGELLVGMFDVGNQLSLKCDGRHEHVPCAGRETLPHHSTLHEQDCVNNSGREESNKRFCSIEAPSTDTCTAGSSGNGNKEKKHIASPCIGKKGLRNEISHDESYTCNFIFRVVELTLRTIVPTNNKSSKPKLRWTCSSLLKRGENLKGGIFSSGAAGAGRATRSDGHKSWSRRHGGG